MCAAMVWHMQTDPLKNLQVYFCEKEKGPSARDTILTAGGNLRREAFAAPADYLKVIENNINEMQL
jgi:hypothetical protein